MTLIRFYKPYGVLSQFRDPERPTLGDYIDRPGVYPAGRLDRDSEGLLLLTDDGPLQARIAEPRFEMEKHYWVQVEAQPDEAEVARLAERLRTGVRLRDGPAHARALRRLAPPPLPPREPPVTAHRDRRSSWLEVVLTEGRNRQVRRMLAALGLPVLRLHRARIGPIDLTGLAPGEWQEIPVPAALRPAAEPPRRRPISRRPGRRPRR
ncbi:MAG TPA: pseudouridine synthase [Pseudomonadales bacterium]